MKTYEDLSEKDTAQSPTNGRVAAERLNHTFNSLLGGREHYIDVDVLEFFFGYTRCGLVVGIFMHQKATAIHGDSVGGSFCSRTG